MKTLYFQTMIKSSLSERKTEKPKTRLESVEIDAISRSLMISRRDIVRNERIKVMTGVDGTIQKYIEKNN